MYFYGNMVAQLEKDFSHVIDQVCFHKAHLFDSFLFFYFCGNVAPCIKNKKVIVQFILNFVFHINWGFGWEDFIV